MEKVDSNNDNKVDTFNFKISFNSDIEKTTDIKLLLLLDYSLVNDIITRYYTQTMLYFHVNSYLGISDVKAVGNLELKQKSALKASIQDDIILNKSILDSSLSTPKDFLSVYSFFKSNNITTSYVNEKFVYNFKSSDTVTLDLVVNIPSYQEILYHAPIVYTLKSTWVQYFCTFAPIAIVLYFILKYSFESRILSSVVHNSNENNAKK